ncbi:MAG: formyltransferase family protein, partial [Myxococcota bacterium]
VPLGAEVLRRAGFAPALSALGPRDLPGRRRLGRLLPNVWTMPNLGGDAFLAEVDRLRPEALLAFFWPKKIPKSLLSRVPAFGTHPSLLPRHRGPDPYFWTLRQGETQTGVTLQRLVEAYDEGPIVATRRVPVRADDTAWSLARRLDAPALELLVATAAFLSRGWMPTGTPQPPGATQAPFPSAEDLRLDWNRPARELEALVRAASPQPGAQALFADTPVEVVRAKAVDQAVPAGLRPAEAWRSEGMWFVRCAEGALRIDRLRDVEGRALEPGSLFERQRMHRGEKAGSVGIEAKDREH